MLFGITFKLFICKFPQYTQWATISVKLHWISSWFFTMVKTKDLSWEGQRLIIDHHNHGMGYWKISSEHNIPISTIRTTLTTHPTSGKSYDLSVQKHLHISRPINCLSIAGLLRLCHIAYSTWHSPAATHLSTGQVYR